MNFTGYPCIVRFCVIHHCVRECMLVSKRFNDIPIRSQLFSLDIFGQTSLHLFYGPERGEITQVHLQGTLTGMHSRTQSCITNEKSLDPFRPREARGPRLSGQAQPGPARPGSRAAWPVPISTINTRNK